jgi:hypothetical protein
MIFFIKQHFHPCLSSNIILHKMPLTHCKFVPSFLEMVSTIDTPSKDALKPCFKWKLCERTIEIISCRTVDTEPTSTEPKEGPK